MIKFFLVHLPFFIKFLKSFEIIKAIKRFIIFQENILIQRAEVVME